MMLWRGQGASVRGWVAMMALGLSVALPGLSPAQAPDLVQGRSAYEQGRYQEALSLLKDVLTRQPDDPEARYYLGLTYQQLGQDRKAAKAFEDLLASHPDDEKAHLPLGLSYYRLHKYRHARTQLELAAKIEKDQAQVSYYQGLVAFKLGEYEEAPPKLLRAMTLAPELALPGHYYAGVAYFKRRLLEDAREEFLEVKRLAPGSEFDHLADHYLKRIERRERGIKSWFLQAMVGIQADENVVLAPTDAVLAAQIARKADTRSLGFFRGGYEPIRTERWVMAGEYNLYQNLHQTLREFNVQSHSAQASASYLRSTIQLRLQYGLDYALLAQEPYFLVQTVSPTVMWLWARRASVELQYRYQAKTFSNTSRLRTNEERSGSGHHAGLTALRTYADGKGSLRAGYAYETDVTWGPDWEATAHLVRAGVSVPPVLTLRLEINGEYLIRQYSNPHSLSPTRERRRDEAVTGTATLSRPVMRRVEVAVQYLYNRNGSNLATFEYQRSVWSVFLMGRW